MIQTVLGVFVSVCWVIFCCSGGFYSRSADVRNLRFDDLRIPVVKRETPRNRGQGARVIGVRTEK